MEPLNLEDHELKALAALCRLMCGLDDSVSASEEAVLDTIGGRVGKERLETHLREFPAELSGSGPALELAKAVTRPEIREQFLGMLNELGGCDGLAPIESALLVELERMWDMST